MMTCQVLVCFCCFHWYIIRTCLLLPLRSEKVIQCLVLIYLFIWVRNNSKTCGRVWMKFTRSLIIALGVRVLPARGLPGRYWRTTYTVSYNSIRITLACCLVYIVSFKEACITYNILYTGQTTICKPCSITKPLNVLYGQSTNTFSNLRFPVKFANNPLITPKTCFHSYYSSYCYYYHYHY